MAFDQRRYLDEPVPLNEQNRSCYLSGIVGLETSTTRLQEEHWIYEVTFTGQTRYKDCKAFVRIPSRITRPDIRQMWTEEVAAAQVNFKLPRLAIPKNVTSTAQATFGDLIAVIQKPKHLREATSVAWHGLLSDGTNEDCENREETDSHLFVRSLTVTLATPAGRQVSGEVAFPPHLSDRIREYAEACLCIESIETEEQEEDPKVRTIIFEKAPQRGARVNVEVWSLDCEESSRETARVVEVEKKDDDYGPIKVVEIWTATAETISELHMKGVLRGDARHGRFEQIR